ncbi:hypothetical protein FACS1894187_02880 [Synergistales bacterium]|nr:hypothetical protein FACS1894187_02880 [Synergistales bacterium]
MGEKDGNKERRIRQPWRSFYRRFLAVAALFAVLLVQHMKAPIEYQKWVWYAFSAVFIVVWISAMLERFGTVFIIKSDEITFRHGIVKFESVEISATDINTISVKQSIIQWILGIGDIDVASAGTAGYEIKARNMPSPNALRDDIQYVERTAKNRPTQGGGD